MRYRLRDKAVRTGDFGARHLLAGLAGTLLLAACEAGPPAVSLEEAKQITATFEGSSFVPPPRTIKDIIAISGHHDEGQKPDIFENGVCGNRFFPYPQTSINSYWAALG